MRRARARMLLSLVCALALVCVTGGEPRGAVEAGAAVAVARQAADEADDWAAVMHAIHHPLYAVDYSYWADCVADDDFLRLVQDSKCAEIWTYLLEHTLVSGVGVIEPVITDDDIKHGARPEKPHQNGGVECLASPVKGYFKPCYGNVPGTFESYFGEIVSFHVDRILGTHRVLPAVPRVFAGDDLLWMADADTKAPKPWKYHPTTPREDIKTIIHHCGTDDLVEGALIGWAPFPIVTLTNDKHMEQLQREHVLRFSHLDEGDAQQALDAMFAQVSNDAPDEDLWLPLESVQFNLYCGVTGYMSRWAHNVYVLQRPGTGEYSPLVYMDNDRSNWRHTTLGGEELPSLEDSPLASWCKFPESVARNVLELDGGMASLSARVRAALAVYADGVLLNGPLLTDDEAAVMDQNVANYATIIRSCVARHGERDVLIREPWRKDYSQHRPAPAARPPRSESSSPHNALSVAVLAPLGVAGAAVVALAVATLVWRRVAARRAPAAPDAAELEMREMTEQLVEDEESPQ